MTVSVYKDYYLLDNPFPETAVCNPYSRDPRLNGSIFCIDIFEEKIRELDVRTKNSVNLIYVSGNQYDRGLGKSALMVNHYKKLKERDGVTCAYVRCMEKEKMEDIAKKVILVWHEEGFLWEAFKESFTAFSQVDRDPLLQPASVKLMFQDYPDPPDILPVPRYTYVRDIGRKIDSYVGWLSDFINADAGPLAALFEDYLSSPSELPDTLSSRKVDCISVYHACLKFLNAYGFSRHYVFFDQFEDMVMGISKSKMGSFALAMKSLLSGASGASVFVSLHPNSEMKLKEPAARDLTSVAPFDDFHRVNLLALDVAPEKAVSLAEEYLGHYRLGEAPYPSYPFEPELLVFTWYFNKGIIRNYLQQLNLALKNGVMLGYPELKLEYALEHQLEILGREVTARMMEEYNRWRGRAAPVKSGRSWGSAIKDFKDRGSRV